MPAKTSTDPWGPPLDAGLAALPCPPLPPALSDRVARLAHAHLAPPPEQAAPALGFRLREALVPALLMSAAVVRTADTVHVARQVFGRAAQQSRHGDDHGRPASAVAVGGAGDGDRLGAVVPGGGELGEEAGHVRGPQPRVGHHAVEIAGHLGGAAVALIAIAAQRLHHHVLQRRGDLLAHAGRPGDRHLQDAVDGAGHALVVDVKQVLQAQHLVQHHAQREQIDPGVDRLAAHLLGRQVAGLALDVAVLRDLTVQADARPPRSPAASPPRCGWS